MIQQLLASAYKGSFERGTLQHRRFGRKLRRRIYRDYLEVICDTLSAAEQGSPQPDSQQHNLATDAAEALHERPRLGLETHSEHHTPNICVASLSSLTIQDPLRPASSETAGGQVAPEFDVSQCEVPDRSVSEHH